MSELALFEALALECRVDEYGTVRYYNTLGQRHRVYGPAVMYADGRIEWYQNAQRHRPDGPAAVWPDSFRAWWQNGRLHRLDGPAIVWANGRHDWYINGKELTLAEWQQVVTSMETV